MQLKLLEKLACPKCHGGLFCAVTETSEDGEIETGHLECTECAQSFPIKSGIPRFVETDNYATSFGYQWNRFRLEQIDSNNGTQLSTNRFYSETGWTKEWLKGKWILDAGCGAGRFMDVAASADCEVVGLDISEAVDAAKANLAGRKNVHFVQASIYDLPFRSALFDGCYCIGVVQHTPDPQKAMQTLPRILRPGGRIAITAYERKPWTLLYGKYLLRPLTKRLDKQTLLAGIKGAMPVLFPITNVLFRLPLAGRLFMFAIPVANYTNERRLTRQQRYDWAILDTFDMLSPQYDQPRTQKEIEEALSAGGVVELQRLVNPGVNIVGRKGS
jgi:2-polyprenyl-3-methyl-5-hydroxy-6-metoxy-1,4-benzoquinol methylase